MARITVEDCLEKVENRFALVLLVARRAKQIIRGAKPVIKGHDKNKNVVKALREVAEGRVSFDIDTSKKSIRDQIQDALTR